MHEHRWAQKGQTQRSGSPRSRSEIGVAEVKVKHNICIKVTGNKVKVAR